MPELVLNSLFTEEHPDGERAWLTRPLILLSRRLQGIAIAPSGFLTDYTSHPLRTARGRYNRASVGHDWLYESQTIVRLVNDEPAIGSVTRKEADEAYLEWMADLGTPFYRRQAFFAAVRVGGWLPWSREDRSEHRPYDYGIPGFCWLNPDAPWAFGYGHEWPVWRAALDTYARSYPRHGEF